MTHIRIPSFAKINLFLQVTGRRADGYHLLKTLMCPLELHDTLSVSFGGPGIRVRCSDPDVPTDEANLAGIAARLFFDALQSVGRPEPPAVRIDIEKQIPMGGGLGGGSSNAATVLRVLNTRYGSVFSIPQLMRMAAQIGADVPFFIQGQPALCLGIGTEVHPFSLERRHTVLLVVPGFSVSTAKVYAAFKLGLTKCEETLRKFTFEPSTKISDGNGFAGGFFDPDLHLCNDLETVTEAMHPEITEIKSALRRCGASGALMSGSGSTVFGLFENRRIAETALDRMASQKGPDRSWRLIITEMLTQGNVPVQKGL